MSFDYRDNRVLLTACSQNVAQLGEKIDDLRTKVSENHQNVEHTVKSSPSVVSLRLESSTETEEATLVQNTSEGENQALTGIPAQFLCVTRSTSSSSERVASSYRQYYATLSNISIPKTSNVESVAETVKWSNNQSDDGTASVLGLAPSTVMVLNDQSDDNQISERQPVVSLVSTFSRTREWLETLSLSENSTGLRQSRSTIAPSEISVDEIQHSIVASDMESFLEHIRYFMPVLAESDDGKEVHEADETQANQDSSYERGLKAPIPPALATDNDGRLDEHTPENYKSLTGLAGSEPIHEADIIPVEVDTEHNGHEDDFKAPGALHSSNGEAVQNHTAVPIDSSEPNIASEPQTGPVSGLSVYAEKRQYYHGTVIDSSNYNSDNTLRVSYGFSQAFVSGTQDVPAHMSLPINAAVADETMLPRSPSSLHSMGVRVFFVQRPTR
jgi:hypothetical protein